MRIRRNPSEFCRYVLSLCLCNAAATTPTLVLNLKHEEETLTFTVMDILHFSAILLILTHPVRSSPATQDLIVTTWEILGRPILIINAVLWFIIGIRKFVTDKIDVLDVMVGGLIIRHVISRLMRRYKSFFQKFKYSKLVVEWLFKETEEEILAEPFENQ